MMAGDNETDITSGDPQKMQELAAENLRGFWKTSF
jgi:hypothetical protein